MAIGRERLGCYCIECLKTIEGFWGRFSYQLGWMYMECIKRLLLTHYDLPIKSVMRTAGGWSADAYIAKHDRAEYFVKVYDKKRPSVQSWIERMDLYLPVTYWLYDNTPLKDKMVVPLLTSSGHYKGESERYITLLYPLVYGVTIGDRPLTSVQIQQLATILAELHTYGSSIPVPTGGMDEDYSLPFLHGLLKALSAEATQPDLQAVLSPHKAIIKREAEALQEVAAFLRKRRTYGVLCHTDVHGWNLMWSNKLILIDWEGLRIAPAEADLFTLSPGFFFDYAKEAFMDAYKRNRKEYRENKDALRFYRLRRRLEDIAEFWDSIENDTLTAEERENALSNLNKECWKLAEGARQ